MKSVVKIQSELKNIRKHSDKFTTASIGYGEKNKQGEFENIYLNINFYGELDWDLKENTLYNITGNLGVSFAYKEYPARPMIHCKKVEVAQPVDPNYVDPVKAANPPSENIPM